MKMKTFFATCVLAAMPFVAQAADFETAKDAVKNMGVGWNLGNTLDATNWEGKDGWNWTSIADHEQGWGQPITKPELLKMMKEAGFGAIRVPVTWFQEMDANGKVNATWMKRVHEIVDYVIDNGMYCIVNVHHDTGAHDIHWLVADESVFNSSKSKYEYLWTQIAEEFKDYGDKLLFESYNEMLDKLNSWCFASFAANGGYNAEVATSAYKAINSYAQSFVNTVRATGGKNANRNLIVNTYAACCGSGTWNNHLKDPLKEMNLPTDNVNNHIIFQVHSYPAIAKGSGNKLVDRPMSDIQSELDDMFSALQEHLQSKGAPIIIGEWGTGDVDKNKYPDQNDYLDRRPLMLEFADYFVKKAKEYNMAPFYWMGLSDGAFRSQPLFSQPDLAETIVKAYHGNTDSFKYPSAQGGAEFVCFDGEKALDWGNGFSISSAAFSAYDKTVKLFLTFKKTAASGSDIQLYYGDWSAKITFNVDGKAYNADYNPGGTVGAIQTVAITFSESVYNNLIKKGLMIHGAGVTVTKAVLKSGTTGVEAITYSNAAYQNIYNLQGQRIDKPSKGIYIRGGKKYIAK